MVELNPDDGITVDIPEPSVNVQVFGEGSIGDAFGGFITSIVSGFNSFLKKIISSETGLKALVNLSAVMIIIVALLVAYRTVGQPSPQ
tara:strand:+ start:2562 stop:2825 length:264 start_codon:yes stop_codon:yes gene_type:complete